MGKLKDFWMMLTAPYEDEQLDDFYEAANMICSECAAYDWDVCEKCSVTAAKRSFVEKFYKNRDVAKR